jgi:hypothetical protein
MFQGNLLKSNFAKADLKTMSVLKIPARTTCPVRLGTTKGRRHTPMAAGFKSVSTVGYFDHPKLFAQPQLVISGQQGDVDNYASKLSTQMQTLKSQCTRIGFIENLKYFKEVSQTD